MVLQFEELIDSPQFTFIVGRKQSPVTISAKALSSISAPLDRLMNGPMKEADDRIAVLADIDKDDFIRLCEYAYRGDYTIPEPTRVWDEDDERTYRSPVPLPSAWNSSNDSEAGLSNSDAASADEGEDEPFLRRAPRSPQPLLLRFYNKEYYDEDTSLKREIEKGCRVTYYNAENLDYTWIFLAHAELYRLANRFLVEKLKDLVLSKLQDFLKRYKIYQSRIEEIARLVRFVYNNDYIPDRTEYSEGIDALRQLIVDFIVIHVESLDTSPLFEELLEEGGQFVLDFYRILKEDRRNLRKIPKFEDLWAPTM